ncbi:MAG TPA: hypothetical protein VF725_08065, partial [Ktedonobacterales bacterium]
MLATRQRRNALAIGGALLCALVIIVALVGQLGRAAAPTTASATPTATHAATPTPHALPANHFSDILTAAQRQADIQWTARQDVAGMTLDEKLGQMFLIETYYQTWTPDIANMVVGMHAGAVIIYAKNMKT